MNDDAKEYEKLIVALESQRKRWDERNQEITKFEMPNRGYYPALGHGPNKGKDRYEDILNESPALALRRLVALMVWGLSDPSSIWFRYSLKDKDLLKYAPVKEHLAIRERGIRSVLRWSNFYSALYTIYQEEIGYGLGVCIEQEDWETLARFYPITAGEYVLASDDRGVINTLGRRYNMTAANIVRKFGKNAVSEPVKNAATKNPYDYYEILHLILPNEDRDLRKIDNRNMPYKSIYFESYGERRVLRISGYPEKPFFAPRWDKVGQSVYCDGIGGLMLGSSMELQEMEKDSITGLVKTVAPPMVGPPEFSENLDLSADGFNPIPSHAKDSQLKSLYEINFNIDGVDSKIRAVEERIASGFFNDLFIYLINNPQATATEILEKKAEKFILLGPVIINQEDDLFEPMIIRTDRMMERVGFFPPPPPELEGQQIEIEYVSQLAIAARMASAQGIVGYMGFVGQAAEIDPYVRHKFDGMEAADEIANLYGIPPKINRSDDKVEVIIQAEQEAIAEQKRTQEMMAMVEGAQKLSQTDTEGKNALTDIAEAAG